MRPSQMSDLCTITVSGEHSNRPLPGDFVSAKQFSRLTRPGMVIGMNERDSCVLSHILSKTFLFIVMLISWSAGHSLMSTIYFSIHLLHLRLEFTVSKLQKVCRYTHLQEMCRNVCSCKCQLSVVDHLNLQYYLSYIQDFKPHFLWLNRCT